MHWTLTLEGRATGWLTPAFHHAWQLILLHASARHDVACPVYVLMPDHAHLVWLGLTARDSDQRLAIEFLRKHLRPALAPYDWQAQAHDRVLRDDEREREAFAALAHYILQNPVRAGLSATASDYSYAGGCVPGYPNLRVRDPEYWPLFWRIYDKLVSGP